MVRYGMVIDLERCTGCRACMEADKVENNTPRGVYWMHVYRYEEGRYPEVDQKFLPLPCQHCQDAPCTKVCPTQARFTREDGLVLTDYGECIGCNYCWVACPYGVNYLQEHREHGQYIHPEDVPEDKAAMPPWHNPEFNERYAPNETAVAGGLQPNGVMGKCTFCVHRRGGGDRTACEETCPVDAIVFGDFDDPESAPNRRLREKSDSPTFRLLEEVGTDPSVIYIGEPPDTPERLRDLAFTTQAHPIEDKAEFKDPAAAMEAESAIDPSHTSE
ncbi:MAG: 4Fe-4S dicluster domain-containing protein [Halodesulfurarchaeum sp.]